MRKHIKTIAAAMASLLVMQTAQAQIPDGYYASLKGKKGAELKTAVHEIIKKADVLDYGSGTGHTWEGFYSTDRMDNGQVVDRYSNDIRYFGKSGSVISGMNIEHSFPKSWWEGTQNQAYKDLYNLMPCEQKINSSKSNYPMGKVTSVKTDNGCTRIGTGNEGYQLWEPADKWKGDFARGYMYMATAYQQFSWSGTQALQILQQGSYPTLRKWAYTLYMEWARKDAVDALEVERNNAVSRIQGNRNPFVDFPNLMEYIWGDSINYAFNPETTLSTSGYGGGGSVTPDPEPTE
uniref:endonuclease I family protein n=1 Tax=uncultured Muribaculum sp. TaxID=1918613 RepID=UPI0027120C70